jgi:cell wall-associated NlpC family hydrolase
MRRGLIAAVLIAAALGTSTSATAASWAQPQIRTVVNHGLMGPSVTAFRPGKPLTRKAMYQAIANLTGQPQVVVDPAKPVLMWELERALVKAAGLRNAGIQFQTKAREAGLAPPRRFGGEVVARLLGLRYNHPAVYDGREFRPQDVATRAEAAYSFAQLVNLPSWKRDSVASLAQSFSLPSFTAWQRTVLKRAVAFVGYPYIWGGTSEFTQTLFGVRSRGGFDCSGFVWRVYKTHSFPGAPPRLRSALRGRTTYDMSGEFPVNRRVRRPNLRPGDLVFFGDRGPSSRPSQVNHMGIYVGKGWFVHSSSQGTTLTTLTGWYADRFAWGRRPLREAGLA